MAIAPETLEQLRGVRSEANMTYNLYSDIPMSAGRAFGVAYRVEDPRYVKMMNERLGVEEPRLPVPSVFLLDANGEIVFSYVNPDYKVRIPAALVLSAVEELIAGNEE